MRLEEKQAWAVRHMGVGKERWLCSLGDGVQRKDLQLGVTGLGLHSWWGQPFCLHQEVSDLQRRRAHWRPGLLSPSWDERELWCSFGVGV